MKHEPDVAGAVQLRDLVEVLEQAAVLEDVGHAVWPGLQPSPAQTISTRSP